MNEIALQTQGPDELKRAVEPLWCASEDTVQKQDCGDGQRDIEHTFHVKGEPTVPVLLQKDTGKERHHKHNDDHPDARSVNTSLTSHHFSHVDADEKNRNTAPKYLDMAHGLVNWRDILHQDTPQNHHNREPTIHGMPANKLHISRGKTVK